MHDFFVKVEITTNFPQKLSGFSEDILEWWSGVRSGIRSAEGGFRHVKDFGGGHALFP